MWMQMQLGNLIKISCMIQNHEANSMTKAGKRSDKQQTAIKSDGKKKIK